MKNKKLTTLILTGLITGLVFIYFPGCKKIDLKRIAYVKTEPAEDVSPASVKATGDIIDLGEGDKVKEYGFCLSYINKPPTLDNKAVPPFENISKTGKFYSNITGLTDNKLYEMRAYVIDNSNEVVYGNIIEFHTPQGGGGPPAWLKYDDGNNFDAIGLIDGGDFDVAIRFPASALTQYSGYKVTKFRFFPFAAAPTSYYVTLWEGTNPPELIYYRQVPNPNIGNWTEFTPPDIHVINASKELWAGYWIVNQPAGEHPAGIDNGPANPEGNGDMISLDGGETWFSMSEADPASFDFNWNLQVYVTNEKGEEVQLVNNIPVYRENSNSKTGNKPLDKIISKGRK